MSVISSPQNVAPSTDSPQPDEQAALIASGAGMSPGRVILRIFALMGLALAACLLVYLVAAIPGAWFPGAKERSFGPAELTVTRGTGRLSNGELHITSPDPMGFSLVSVVTSFRSSDYPAVAWLVADMPEKASVQLLWRTDYAPEKLNSVRVTIEAGRALPVMLVGNPAWIGRITGIALAVQGNLPQPIRIGGVVVKPMGAVEILRDRAREWFQLERWSGASINTITGGADVQDLPLPVLIACVVGLAALLSYAIDRWRPGTLGATFPIAAALLFVAGWLVLDTRWTANLARQETITARQYAGKDSRARHLAAEDAPLFAFIERARQVLPTSPARIIVAADADYFRGRAAYHLYPHSVFFDPRSTQLPPANNLKAGDWLIVFERRGIQYDRAHQMLRWEVNQTRPAELKYVEPGGAVFLIR